MSDTGRPGLPIGYWLKRADAAITARADEAQRANGVTRVEWQMLNLLHESGGMPAGRARDTMRPFLDDTAFDEVAAGLTSRGLIAADGDALNLTGEGRRRHADMLAVQLEVRRLTMQGVDEADYATAVRVLQRIVTNLTT